jgi:hypothetical protein
LLQHNATVHHVQLVPDSSRDIQCKSVGGLADDQYPAAPEVTSSHHRRKPFKQNRVVNVQLSDGDTVTSNSDGESNVSVESDKSQDDSDKFWTSLGLKSRLSSMAETTNWKGEGRDSVAAAASDNSTAGNGLKSKFIAEASEFSVADSCSTSGLDETDLDYMETDASQTDQLVDLSVKSSFKHVPETVSAESITPGVGQLSATRRRRWSWTRGIEGFNWRTGLNQTMAEENGGFRRRRKLRTCDKCGYVTDNLTTLQRHVAKHGSAGNYSRYFVSVVLRSC